MVEEKLKYNALDLHAELNWFRQILRTRSQLNSKTECKYTDIFEVKPPEFNGSPSSYAHFVKKHELSFEERFLLILAMVPHLKPELLDVFLQRNNNTEQIYTEFGGKRGKNHTGFLPTGETLMFLLAGTNLERRFNLLYVLDSEHHFSKNRVVWLDDATEGEPQLNGAITISKEILDEFTIGFVRKPTFSSEFPAKLLKTKMDWGDLVLPSNTMSQLVEIEAWLQHHNTLMHDWEMHKILKPGYKTLFHGPPGTGKSLTTALLGKKTGIDVYRIDLSRIISKYIGETEKNLSKIFDRAESKGWILFFDEADALFGKRTSINDAHDRYANQEVSFLLQRIEEYDGLVILASNLKKNIDEAFQRRFQSMIFFPMPRPEERLKLWKNGFSNKCILEEKIDLNQIASNYELAGGSIINIIQYCSLMALNKNTNVIVFKDIIEGIKREFGKGGRTI
jgi:hypothetical protein